MLEYISQHPIAGVALVLLAVLTFFVCVKALLSGKKRNEEREKIIADIEKEKALRKEFKYVDATTFAEGKDDYRLITGMCAHIQQLIEKKEDMTAAFLLLSQAKKYVYALGYVFEDSRNGLSDFFRSNGEPLLSTANQAVSEIIGGQFAEIFAKEFVMLDENDETTSVDNEALKRMDEDFKTLMDENGNKIYACVADFIRLNKNDFISGV
ncbi:MAG: hypothetical protein IJ447_01740 [Clostridia bacterium]|nr:hypothetical protein [Clostridia bacterium]